MAEAESTNAEQNIEDDKGTKAGLNADNYLLVVALDFGTTYSGYAFNTRNDFNENPLKIQTNQEWKAEGTPLISMKTPTSILIKRDGTFLGFGYEAEDKFYSEMEGGDRENVMLFRRFKMKLHNKTGIRDDLMIEDVAGREYSAKIIFTLSIKALADHFKSQLKKQTLTGPLNDEDIKWVLTVPAIWSDAAKKYMRKCASDAGLPDEMLQIALEPEAASIYVQYLPIERNQARLEMTTIGTKYMVVDIGGGTADITVHEKIEGGKLKELHQATGGACGGTSVDRAFENRLAEILGENVMKKLREEETETYLDILREFEIAKRGIKPESTGITRMTTSYVVLNKLCSEVENKTLEEMFANTEGMKIRADKLRIDAKVMMNFFQPSINELIQHIQNVLKKPSATGVSIILLVGGSADCALIQAKIKESFNSLHLVIPPEAGLAVLRGAVIFGHCPRLIKSRVLRYTYGVKLCPTFDPNKHKEEKKISILNEDRCKDYFKTLISVGTDVEIGHQKFEVYQPTCFLSPEVLIQIYCSPKKDVQYVDDEDCFQLGELRVPLDLTGGNAIARLFFSPIKVAYTFGDTELKVWAVDQVSGNQTSCTIEMQEESIANEPSSPME